jgi:adenylate cyclase
MNFKNSLEEFKRRNVFKAAIAYLVVSWLLVQVFSIILPAFEANPVFLKAIIIIQIIGFPIWIIFSWVFEFTPEGLKKTTDVKPDASIMPKTGSRINKVIIFALTLTIVILIIERFTNKPLQVLDYGEKGIAVLAFADMSPNKDHEYFSDGISEELLNILVKIPNLKVISRTSSFSYKEKNATAIQIGKDLNVSHILEGSIRKAGNMVRITAQLIKTSDGSHEWSHTFDRNLDSIFKIQDEIAREVSKQLELSLMDKSMEFHEEPDTKAYNLYLQARHLIHLNTKDGYLLAEDLIKKSIAIDSTYSNSWDLLASIYNTGSFNFGIGEIKERMEKGLIAAKKAVKINPINAEAYATLASIQENTWDFDESEKNMQKALELQPNSAILIGTAALMTYGDLEKTVALIKRAIELDPLVYTNYYNLGHTYLRLNRLDNAMEAFNKFTTYYPNTQILHYMKGKVLLAQGKKSEALIEFEQETHDFFGLYGKNFIYYALGKQKQSDAVFQEFIEKFSLSDPANMADLYAFRGDYESSFKWLNKAYEFKDPVLLEALTYPSFKPMHSDPRWNTFINKLGLPKNHGYTK